MIRLAANLHTMYTDVVPLMRFEAAQRSGFDAVEIFLVGSMPAKEVQSRLDALGLGIVQIYADCGAFDDGERGIAIFAERRDEFRYSIEKAVRYAQAVGSPWINCLAGIGDPAAESARYQATLIENLEWAAQACAGDGIGLLLEPISNQGPNYFVRHTAQARALIEHVGQRNLRMLYDVYHAQMLEGNLTESITENLDVIGHVQIADVPGRHEPGTGEICFPYLLESIDSRGYGGWIGLEYFPSPGSEETLGWARPYMQRLREVASADSGLGARSVPTELKEGLARTTPTA